MSSIVIAAHDEAGGVGDTLRGVLAHAEPDEFEVVVVANGCSDNTASVARAVPGVAVLELPVASKPAALNAGDAVATRFPRLYLDADVRLDTADVRTLLAAVATSPAVAGSGGDPADGGAGGEPADGPDRSSVLAAAPRRVLDTAGRPLLVRAYFAVNGRLPAFRGSLFGRGAIAVSAVGRGRFDTFPDVVADDMFLDSLFLPAEKREVTGARAVVATPHRTRDLLRRLGRVRAGAAMLRTTEQRVAPVRGASWLVDVVLPRPWLLPAGICYALLTVLAELSARRPATRRSWGRDESSRAGAAR
ncbi:glycosyltransferase family 2 protein [Plantactinospora sp. GCM10030261]|uniref:glycosyltransferase family 2 protein n=1 Tax=Plantactinospora sp. GCM10030261 TaxID=3273420 RepID=UPI00360F6679